MAQEYQEQKDLFAVDGKWDEEAHLNIVRKTTEWKIRSLQIYQNRRPIIVKDISHIHFSRLNHLGLWANQIESIQIIANIHMPYLRILQLQVNNIGYLREIRKAQWPKLKTLCLWKNYISDYQHVIEGFFPKLECLEGYHFASEQNIFIDSSFLIKLQTQLLNTVWISQKFSFKRCLNRIISKKWKNIKIH